MVNGDSNNQVTARRFIIDIKRFNESENHLPCSEYIIMEGDRYYRLVD